tara:strand:+ start:957 stop:1160 length:204 start_codon:yes stop_codon:yes gene_type:complete
MIKSITDKKITPKQKAKEQIADLLGRMDYWREFTFSNHEHMTQREDDEVQRHIEIQLERIRNLGFDF